VQYSRAHILSYVVEGLNLITEQNLQYTGAEDILGPQSIFYKIVKYHNELKRTSLRVSNPTSYVYVKVVFGENNGEMGQKRLAIYYNHLF